MIDEFDLRGERVVLTKSDWLEDVALPDPRTLGYQEVLLLLRDRNFEGLRDKRISIYSIETIHNLWRAVHDLPEINAAIRLTYVVDHYEGALAYDLQHHLNIDLESLWLERRWGRLLNHIDRLPSHTWYSQAVSEDPEHTELLAKQLAESISDESEKKGPPIHTWSPEVNAINDVVDAVKELTHVTSMAYGGKGEPRWAERPNADLKRQVDRLKFERRKAAHEKLVSRMLPNR